MKKIMYASLVVILLLIVGCSKENITGNAVEDLSAKEIKVRAFQFGYDPMTITVNKGERVKIVIDNLDTPHGMRIPDFGVKGTDGVEFVANKTGSFPWYCNVPCGPGHRAMNGTLVVI